MGFLIGASALVFNCGELIHFFEKGFDEPCSCGKSFKECDFWMKIREKCKHINNVFGFIEYELFKAIYEEISKTYDVEYILDVSKDVGRLEKLTSIKDLDVYVIYLIRDLRGFINSVKKYRKDYGFLGTVRRWVREQRRIESFLKKFGCRFIRINYDNLCRNTSRTIKLINDFLKIKNKDNGMFMAIKKIQHVFAGNWEVRMRLKNFTSLKCDNSFEKLNMLERLGGTILWWLYKITKNY